jgi:hypothetical protein
LLHGGIGIEGRIEDEVLAGLPGRGVSVQVRATTGELMDDGSENQSESDGSNRAIKPSRFDRQLKLTDLFIVVFGGLSFAAAAVSAAVAVWTAGQLKSASLQTDNAIGRIAAVANATEDEANSVGNEVSAIRDQGNTMGTELGEMQNQTGILANQVGEAKKQTKAISEQTTAIKDSSAAAVKSAGAQIETATAQRQSAQVISAASIPEVGFVGVDITGMDGKPEQNGLIKVSVKPHFSNTGGGAMYQKGGVFALTRELATKPDYANIISFGGNELTVFPTGIFQPDGDVILDFKPEEAKGIIDGTIKLFIYGYVDYFDGAKTEHRTCFADRIATPKGHPFYYFAAGGPDYHCQT